MRAAVRAALLPVVFASGVLLFAASARAQNPFDWDSGRDPDGAAATTLFSINSLTTGSRAIDYHPVLAISCDAKRYPVWRQSVRIRDAVSGDGSVAVSVRLDNGEPFTERWMLRQKNRALSLDGGELIGRLQRARRMAVQWRLSYFSGRGEAVFNLAGVKPAVAELAERCGVAAP